VSSNIKNTNFKTKEKISIIRVALGVIAALIIISLLGIFLYSTNIIDFSTKYFDVKIEGSGIHIVNYTGKEKSITVPETINSRKVIAIDKKAFYNNDYIKKVTLPKTLKDVGDKAFANCKNLSEVNFTSNFTNFGNYVFENSNVEKVTLPSNLQKISCGMFKNCKHISTVSFPDDLKEISKEAFYGCTSLGSIVIGENVYKIGENAFGGNGSDFRLSSMMDTETERYALANNILYTPCNSHYKPYNIYHLSLGINPYSTQKVSDINTGILAFSPPKSGYYKITLTTNSNNEIKIDPTDDSAVYCSSLHGNKKDIICKYQENSTYYIRILASESFNYSINLTKISNAKANLYKKGEQLLKGESTCKLTTGTELRENHNNSSNVAASVSSDIILTKILDYYIDSKSNLWCKINANVSGHGNKNMWFTL
jgi:hypothetical protein